MERKTWWPEIISAWIGTKNTLTQSRGNKKKIQNKMDGRKENNDNNSSSSSHRIGRAWKNANDFDLMNAHCTLINRQTIFSGEHSIFFCSLTIFGHWTNERTYETLWNHFVWLQEIRAIVFGASRVCVWVWVSVSNQRFERLKLH